MDKKYQKMLLELLFKHYPNFSDKWIDTISSIVFDLPTEEEQKKNMAYLLERHYIERHPATRAQLRITADGVDYLEKLRQEEPKPVRG